MRAFVFLLILANLLFFAWTQGLLGAVENPDALRLQQQLRADQLRVVSRSESEQAAAEKKTAAAEKTGESCLLLAEVAASDLPRLEKLLQEKFPALSAERAPLPGSQKYWVYIPPLASKAETERKVGELKRLRVADFFVIQEAGPFRFAISLGIFSSKEGASEYLARLRAQGVRSARLGERETRPVSAQVQLRGAPAEIEALRRLLGEVLPGNAPAACPASRPEA